MREQLARPAAPRAHPAPAKRRVASDDAPPDDDGRGLSSERPRETLHESAELEALRLFVHRRDEIGSRLRPVLFASGLARSVFTLLASAADIHEAILEAPPAIADLLARLAVEESTAEVDDVANLLLGAATARAIATLGQEARLAEDPLAYAEVLRWLKQRLDELRGDEPAVEISDQLLAWLEEHAAEFA